MNVHGRARVDPDRPQAFAKCDRCGFLYNLVDLRYQFEWAGAALINTRFKVCDRCLDVPNEQLRTVILPPDPVPVIDPRPLSFAIDEIDYRVTEDGDLRVTEADEPRVLDSTASQEPPPEPS